MSDITAKSTTTPDAKALAKPATAANDAGENPSRSSRSEPDRGSLMRWISQRFRGKSAADFRDDLTDALAENDADGSSFSAGEREMLNNILTFREVSVEDVMIPRADVLGVDINTTLAVLLDLFESSGHSRMPVYSGDLDDPKGMVHIRDVLGHITRSARTRKPSRAKSAQTRKAADASILDLAKVDLNKTIGELKLIREVLFVPHSMLAGDLLQRMKSSRTQMALVIDEYGGTDGLVSMEDVVEMVVGNIEDEHDDEALQIIEQEPGVYIVDGGAELEDVTETIGSDFVVGEDGEDVDTVGGLVISALGRLPHKGETFMAIPGFEFMVLESSNRRIKKVRITRVVSA